MRLAHALVVVVVAAAALALGAGCEDPCVTLANRICACETNSSARQFCRTDRIVNQQATIDISDADRDFCAAKLDTCTCDALDENDFDKCGFVPEGGQ